MKRLTETSKWRDPWYRRLSPPAKLLWLYILDECDMAGVVRVDFEFASFQIGSEVTEKDMTELGDRVIKLKDGKHWVPSFIKFQYGTLSETSLVHRSVLKAVANHGLVYPIPCNTDGDGLSDTLSDTVSDRHHSPMGIPSPKEKEKEKEKAKEGGVGEEAAAVIAAWNESGFPKVQLLSAKRSSTLNARLSDKFFLTNWRSALEKIKASDFCHGGSPSGWKADIEFFLRPDTCLKIMEGRYANKTSQPQPSQRKQTDAELLAEAMR